MLRLFRITRTMGHLCKEKGAGVSRPFRDLRALVLSDYRAFAHRGFANGNAASNAQKCESCDHREYKLLHEEPPVQDL